MKRPACDVIANRRVLKLRPGYSKLCRRHGETVRARGALRPGHRGPSARRTPPPVSSGRSDQLQPLNRCPAEEGLITPTAERCPAGEGLITPTAGRGPKTKGLSLRRYVRAACEGLITPQRQHSLVGRLFGLTRAEGLTSRFLGRETLEKPETASIITAAETRMEALWRPAAKSLPFMALLLHERVLDIYPTKLPATSTTVPA